MLVLPSLDNLLLANYTAASMLVNWNSKTRYSLLTYKTQHANFLFSDRSGSSAHCFLWNAVVFSFRGKTGWATSWILQPRQARYCHLFKHDLEENHNVYTCLTWFCT